MVTVTALTLFFMAGEEWAIALEVVIIAIAACTHLSPFDPRGFFMAVEIWAAIILALASFKWWLEVRVS